MCLLARIPAVRVSEGRALCFFLASKSPGKSSNPGEKDKVIVPSSAVCRSNQTVLLEEVLNQYPVSNSFPLPLTLVLQQDLLSCRTK